MRTIPGTAPGSAHSFAEVLEHLKKVDAVVFTVGLGPKIDRPVLEQLAALSGGEAYFPEDVSVLATDFNRILETLRRRYVISYTSTNSTRDGAWRKVEITSVALGISVAAAAATSPSQMISNSALRRVLPAPAVALLGTCSDGWRGPSSWPSGSHSCPRTPA